MSDFIPTVTITLAEYDQLRRDAAPVQNRVRMKTQCLIDAYNEYTRACSASRLHDAMGNAQERLGKYMLYVQRCVMSDVNPVPFGNWQAGMKPGDMT